jgi:hypothetical protein
MYCTFFTTIIFFSEGTVIFALLDPDPGELSMQVWIRIQPTKKNHISVHGPYRAVFNATVANPIRI